MSLRTVPESLRIDPDLVVSAITESIRGFLSEAGVTKIVLGLSGGVDSAVVAALCVQAAGRESVTPFILPYSTSSPASAADARTVAGELGLSPIEVDLSPMADPFFAMRKPDAMRKGNALARLRMIVLFDAAKDRGALVAGTGNKTETLMGYFTWYGDAACSFFPIAALYKSQVWQLAEHLRLPVEVIHKAPTADLWPGQTDEDEMGLTYEEMDFILHSLVDLRRSPEQVVAAGFARDRVNKALDTMKRTEFKRRLPPVASITRTPRPA